MSTANELLRGSVSSFRYLDDRDAPLAGRAMTDALELVHKADLDDRRGLLSPRTMAEIDNALRDVLALH